MEVLLWIVMSNDDASLLTASATWLLSLREIHNRIHEIVKKEILDSIHRMERLLGRGTSNDDASLKMFDKEREHLTEHRRRYLIQYIEWRNYWEEECQMTMLVWGCLIKEGSSSPNTWDEGKGTTWVYILDGVIIGTRNCKWQYYSTKIDSNSPISPISDLGISKPFLWVDHSQKGKKGIRSGYRSCSCSCSGSGSKTSIVFRII